LDLKNFIQSTPSYVRFFPFFSRFVPTEENKVPLKDKILYQIFEHFGRGACFYLPFSSKNVSKDKQVFDQESIFVSQNTLRKIFFPFFCLLNRPSLHQIHVDFPADFLGTKSDFFSSSQEKNDPEKAFFEMPWAVQSSSACSNEYFFRNFDDEFLFRHFLGNNDPKNDNDPKTQNSENQAEYGNTRRKLFSIVEIEKDAEEMEVSSQESFEKDEKKEQFFSVKFSSFHHHCDEFSSNFPDFFSDFFRVSWGAFFAGSTKQIYALFSLTSQVENSKESKDPKSKKKAKKSQLFDDSQEESVFSVDSPAENKKKQLFSLSEDLLKTPPEIFGSTSKVPKNLFSSDFQAGPWVVLSLKIDENSYPFPFSDKKNIFLQRSSSDIFSENSEKSFSQQISDVSAELNSVQLNSFAPIFRCRVSNANLNANYFAKRFSDLKFPASNSEILRKGKTFSSNILEPLNNNLLLTKSVFSAISQIYFYRQLFFSQISQENLEENVFSLLPPKTSFFFSQKQRKSHREFSFSRF
jgi:hypothetical protein